MPVNKEYVWVIAYINRKFVKNIENELRTYKYNVEPYIPMIKVLKKKYKGKDIFEFVPLLMNYGFFKVSYHDACNPDFLMELRYRVSAIYGWVKDFSRLNTDGVPKEDKALPAIALATDAEVTRLIKSTEVLNIYSKDELDRFKPGDWITLKGYPFDNMPAEIVKIKKKSQEVVVKLQMELAFKTITVSFENIFYSIYDEESIKEDSLDDLSEAHGDYIIDKITFKNSRYEY